MKQRFRQLDQAMAAAVDDAAVALEGGACSLSAASLEDLVGPDGQGWLHAEGSEPALPRWLVGAADGLRRGVARCVARAAQTGREQYLALRLPVPPVDPLALFAAAEGTDRFFWQQPVAGVALAASGCVRTLEAEAPRRFSSASSAARALLSDSVVCGEQVDRSLPCPLLVGGFAFSAHHRAVGDWSAFPGACLFLPEILLACRDGRGCLTVNTSIAPRTSAADAWSAVLTRTLAAYARLEGLRAQGQVGGGSGALVRALRPADGCDAQPGARDRYRRRIEAALAAIAAGTLEKVVLARSLRMLQPGGFDVPAILHRLRAAYPDCVSLALGRGADCFVAASPERLVGFDGELVETEALAGTAPRGATAEDDQQLARALQDNPKERAEHAAVVRAIRDALADVCTGLEGPAVPQLLRLAGIQHLHTPLRGRLRQARVAAGLTILDLVGRLHPTPAVGGLPRAAALDWIGRGEELERGWYAGPVGYMDFGGGGEFRVALRSALLRNPSAEGGAGVASLFAGAGVVAGSQPEREWRETSLKMRALLTPLMER